MPPRSAEEKARRKLLSEQRKAARLLKKKKEEESNKNNNNKTKNEDGTIDGKDGNNGADNDKLPLKECGLFTLSEDSFHQILNYLPARDLGAFSMTCRNVNFGMEEARTHHLLSRLQAQNNSEEAGKLQVPIQICKSESQVKELLRNALDGCGNTGRLVTKKGRKGAGADEYIAYARFVEEAVLGRSIQVSICIKYQ